MQTSSISAPAFSAKTTAQSTAWLLLVYVFMLYSRLFEATALIGLPNLYLIMILSTVGLLTVILRGTFLNAAKTPIGLCLVAFTFWGMLIIPFSQWKSESVNYLLTGWSKSIAVFFIIVGLTKNFKDIQGAVKAVGYGAAASILLLALVTKGNADRLTAFGSLANPNEVAFHIMLGLPFIIWLAGHSKIAIKLPLLAVALLGLALSLKTASRGGLLIACGIVLVSLLKVSFTNKAKIGAIIVLGAMVGALTIDTTALDRYRTMFGSADNSAEYASAVDSANSRKYLLHQSIDLTLMHPLFGVGMGVFPSAAAELSRSRGERALWQVSHNAYTQVSSEMGVIGFVLYVGSFVVCLINLLKLDAKARKLNLIEVRGMALCILLGFVALSIQYFFDAIGYGFYFPLVAGLTMALIRSSEPLIQEAEARASGNPIVGDAPLAVNLEPAMALAGTTVPAQEKTSAIKNQPKNPYRFGRRRVSNIRNR